MRRRPYCYRPFFYLTICLSSIKGILCTNCFPKPSRNLENMLSKWFGSCFHISFSKSLETTGKVLMGLYLSLWFLEASLKQVYICICKTCRKLWCSNTFIKFKIDLVSKKLFIFIHNFDWNISVLNGFLNTQLSYFFKYSIFINNWKVKDFCNFNLIIFSLLTKQQFAWIFCYQWYRSHSFL